MSHRFLCYIFIVIQFQALKISSMLSSLIMNDLEACFKISTGYLFLYMLVYIFPCYSLQMHILLNEC